MYTKKNIYAQGICSKKNARKLYLYMQKSTRTKNTLHTTTTTNRSTDLQNMDVNTSLLTNVTSDKLHH